MNKICRHPNSVISLFQDFGRKADKVQSTAIMGVNAPLTVNASGRYLKTGKMRTKRPLSKQKCEKRPGLTVNAPPYHFFGKRPGAELASLSGVGEGAVPKQTKACFFISRGTIVNGTKYF